MKKYIAKKAACGVASVLVAFAVIPMAEHVQALSGSGEHQAVIELEDWQSNQIILAENCNENITDYVKTENSWQSTITELTRALVEKQLTVDEAEASEEAESIEEEIEYEVLGAADWFSTAQYILKRGDTALITDVETGRSFYIVRTYGTNHADVEPLTQEDADAIWQIWGGWSWTRRAVTVTVDNVVMAASMAAMPHAGLDSQPANAYVSGRSGGYGYGQNLDAIKGNGVDGHMDLHFSGSRTHTSNRVNSDHQNMVLVASSFISENYQN